MGGSSKGFASRECVDAKGFSGRSAANDLFKILQRMICFGDSHIDVREGGGITCRVPGTALHPIPDLRGRHKFQPKSYSIRSHLSNGALIFRFFLQVYIDGIWDPACERTMYFIYLYHFIL